MTKRWSAAAVGGPQRPDQSPVDIDSASADDILKYIDDELGRKSR